MTAKPDTERLRELLAKDCRCEHGLGGRVTCQDCDEILKLVPAAMAELETRRAHVVPRAWWEELRKRANQGTGVRAVVSDYTQAYACAWRDVLNFMARIEEGKE